MYLLYHQTDYQKLSKAAIRILDNYRLTCTHSGNEVTANVDLVRTGKIFSLIRRLAGVILADSDGFFAVDCDMM